VHNDGCDGFWSYGYAIISLDHMHDVNGRVCDGLKAYSRKGIHVFSLLMCMPVESTGFAKTSYYIGRKFSLTMFVLLTCQYIFFTHESITSA
jgi:hypothetical protein